jgi:ADP-dependent phosphofructokinase/glucokinase
MLSMVHPQVRVAGPDGTVLVRAVESAGRGRAPHHIVEFTEGVPAGELVPPRSSRVIVRFDDDPLAPDPWFIRASADAAASAGAAILSGFNALPDGALARVLTWVRPLADAWRAAGLRWVHLELGDFTDPTGVGEVLEGLGGTASSLGLSESELTKLVPDGTSVADCARTLAERYGFDRIAVHADRFALSLTRDDPAQELDALMAGALVAATRAFHGRIAVPHGCPPGVAFAEPPEAAIGRRGAWHLACCPTPYLPRPAATIGLGDTFLAGTLLVLSQAAGQPTTTPSRVKEITA